MTDAEKKDAIQQVLNVLDGKQMKDEEKKEVLQRVWNDVEGNLTARDPLADLWSKMKYLVAILVGALLLVLPLSIGACFARVQNPAESVKSLQIGDCNQGKIWATELLGLAGTIAGFLGIARATQLSGAATALRAQVVQGGMISVLAGVTLLGVGGWAVPVGLGAMAAGAATVGVVRASRGLS